MGSYAAAMARVALSVLDERYEHHLRAAWQAYGDPRSITSVVEVSAKVSTNRVYRLRLDDGHSNIAKVSSYGSYFLSRRPRPHPPHSRRAAEHALAGLLADVLTERDDGSDGSSGNGRDRVFTFYNDELWTAFYQGRAAGPFAAEDPHRRSGGRSR